VSEVKVKSTETGKTETIKADLVLLAMGFVHPEQSGLVENLKLSLDARKNIAGNENQQTSTAKVFVAGDATSGASLVVRAIASGRKTAKAIDDLLERK
jgi:glutamate synthase (NADPH/NADH) small chain